MQKFIFLNSKIFARINFNSKTILICQNIKGGKFWEMKVAVSRFNAIRLPLKYRAFHFSRFIYTQTPFDIEKADDKYKDLNNMYTEMFSETTKKDTAINAEGNSAASLVSELDEVNAELASLCNVSYNILSSTELEEVVSRPGRFIIKSLSNNPFYNLALEEYVFNKTPLPIGGRPFSNERLMFYINDRCVVIGKNQNPWKEVFLEACKAKGYTFVRRRSGGGAVVHDLGNVNYSFLTSRDNFKREYFNEIIVKYLNKYQKKLSSVPRVGLNERGDITLGNKKVSGSAFKIAKGKSYHHGTMLIHSQLSNFKGLLKPDSIPNVTWDCNSVESVRSDVDNLQGKLLDTTEEFTSIVSEGFRQEFGDDIPVYYCDERKSVNEELLQTIELLQSFEWRFKSGPKFMVKLGAHQFKVEKGEITESTVENFNSQTFYDFVAELNKCDELYNKLGVLI